MNSKRRKELGNWGEKVLDEWMKQHDWNPINKNLRIKKGEIDRVYFCENKETLERKYCVAEIKTALFYKAQDIEVLFMETGVKRYLKQRQIQNLYRYGENLIAMLHQYKTKKFKVYLRFFIVFKYARRLDKLNLAFLPKTRAIKNCFRGEGYFIFSIEPEFTSISARKSLLQIKVN